MEFEDVSKKVEKEARRVAAAFKVSTFQKHQMNENESNFIAHFSGSAGGGDRRLYWQIGKNERVTLLWLGTGRSVVATVVEWESSLRGPKDAMGVWAVLLNSPHDEQMAQGLYRLGFESSELPPLSLTAHEKLELRLSMPREFWPQKWLDEESAG